MCIRNMCPLVMEPLEAVSDTVKIATEFIGTFIFVHVICLVVNSFSPTNPSLAAIPIGLTLMVLIFCWGHVSGGHFNPAVSTGLWVSGKMGGLRWVFYVVAQLIGGICGGLMAVAVCDKSASFPTIHLRDSDDWGIWTEFLFTFLLVSTVCNTAATSALSYKANSFFALAIGSSVIIAVAASGGISGGAFNPAVLVGVNVGTEVFKTHHSNAQTPASGRSWALILLMQFTAGAVAGLYFALTEQVEKDVDSSALGEATVPEKLWEENSQEK